MSDRIVSGDDRTRKGRGAAGAEALALGRSPGCGDAAILARCIEKVDGEDIEGAFQCYEAHRKPRTSRIQAISSANTWMKGGDEDTSWLYGYDAWNVPLAPMEPFVKTV